MNVTIAPAARINWSLMHAGLLVAASAQAQTPACDQFKGELAARLHSDVRGYTLDGIPASAVVPPGAKVIGTCGGGAYKILLSKGSVVAEPPIAVPLPVAHPAQLAPSIAAAPPIEAPVPAPPVVASIVAPVVAAPALAPQVHVAAVQEVSASQSRGFIAEYWRLLIALALLPIAVWGWRWWAYRRIYDSSGLPRGPRL